MAPPKHPLIELNRRAMEYIWSQVPKEIKDGKEYVTYVKTDIPYLYYSGLVDTVRFSLEEWQKAFEDCLGEDGRYWVSHGKMITLGRFRFHKTVAEPFDPLKMRVGEYNVERLWKVYQNSVIPSCSIPKEFMKAKFDQLFRKGKKFEEAFSEELKTLKEEGEEADTSKIIQLHFEGKGKEKKVTVTKDFLVNLRNFIDTYPSPRRKLELSVQQMRQEKLQQLSDLAKNVQKSSFEAGKDFRETTKESLKDMLVKASEKSAGGRKPMDEVLDLKSLQKKKPPTKF